MRASDRKNAEILNEYWDGLVLGRPVPQAVVGPGIESTIRVLNEVGSSLRPRREFVDALWQDLLANQAIPSRRSLHQRILAAPLELPNLRWAVTAAVLALIFSLVALVVYSWVTPSETVNADQVIAKASAVAAGQTNVKSFELSQVVTTSADVPRAIPGQELPTAGEIRSEGRAWHKAPNKWRFEMQFTSLPGLGPDPSPRITVADGLTIWTYDPRQNRVQVAQGELGGPGKGEIPIFGGTDLKQVLADASACFEPVITGEEQVAGRVAHKIDLGASKCPSASAPSFNGPRTVWIDKETFFVLRYTILHADGPQPIQNMEVTNVIYNLDISDEIFTFTPPTGAVTDGAPSPEERAPVNVAQVVRDLANQVDFELFVPHRIPSGFLARRVGLDLLLPWQQLSIDYVPSERKEQNVPAAIIGFTVIQRKATATVIADQIQGAEQADIAGRSGWLKRGEKSEAGTGTPSAAIVERNGTLIIVFSFELLPEALIDITASMEAASR